MISRLMIASLLLAITLTSMVHAHSWIDCVDYTEKNGRYYSASKCRARPRNWAMHTGGGVFGADTGYNQQSTTCKYVLANSNFASFYTSAYPMATYKPGQEVCLAWPAKNHVAATCTNQYIPDTSNKIFISQVNPSADPAANSWSLLVDWGNNPTPSLLGSTGGKAFQNCPAFCENMDKALCTGCFTIPANQPEGRYAFQWRWVFNPNTDPYTSCWDASISASANPAAPTPAPSTTQSAPSTPLVGNSIRISSPPTVIGVNPSTIAVKVDYSATDAVDIVVDLLQPPSYTWYGKAIQKSIPAGTGSLDLTIKVQNNPQPGTYVIKPWIVAAGKGEADQGWTAELDRKEYTTTISNVANPTASTGAKNDAEGRVVSWILVVVSCVLVVLL